MHSEVLLNALQGRALRSLHTGEITFAQCTERICLKFIINEDDKQYIWREYTEEMSEATYRNETRIETPIIDYSNISTQLYRFSEK